MKIGKTYYSLAAEYAYLVGKYIRMERYTEPDDAEFHDPSNNGTIGMECTVAFVRDCVEEMEPAIEIMGDYGMGFVIYPQRHDWRYTIWESEEARKQWKNV